MPLDGVHSINASAGTGKTFTITTLYLRYLLEAKCSVDEILVTTFTEAATAELKERLRTRLLKAYALLKDFDAEAEVRAVAQERNLDGQIIDLLANLSAYEESQRERLLERLEDARLSFDQAPVFTIHGFCHQVLQQLVFETGSRFQLDLLKSQQALIDDAVKDFVARWWTAPNSPLAEWMPLKSDVWALLHKVANEALRYPADEIVPAPPDDKTLPGDEGSVQASEFATFQQLAQELTDCWVNSRDEICEIVDRALFGKVLNNLTHNPKLVDDGYEFIRHLIANPSPFEFKFDPEGKLESLHSRFTQSRLEGCTVKAKKGQTPKHYCFQLMDELATLAKEIQHKSEDVRVLMLSRLASFVRQRVAQHKDQHGQMSFSDLLHWVDDALGQPDRESLRTSLRERFRVAMVDEFQDTDPVQFRIFSRIFLDAATAHEPRVDELETRIGDFQPPNTATENRRYESDSEPDSKAFEPSGFYSNDEDPFGNPSSFYDDVPEESPSSFELFAHDHAEQSVTSDSADDEDRPLESTETFRAFVMIGDPKQSIYKFRGADLKAYLTAVAQVPDDHRHEMDRNWRSDQSLVNAVQAFFQSTRNPFLSSEIALPHVTAKHPDRFTAGPAFEVRVVPRTSPDGKTATNRDGQIALVLPEVVQDIVRKLNSEMLMPDGDRQRAVQPGDIAILCRAKDDLRDLQQLLTAYGVPAVMHVDESVYATNEAAHVEQLLQAILNATGGRYLATALQTPICGLSASEIDRVLNDEELLARWSERLRDWSHAWQRDGFVVMWRRLLSEMEVITRLAGLIGGERQITNYLHLGELLHQHATMQHAGPEALIRWLNNVRQDPDTGDEVAQLRLETDSQAVQLITIHKSKGLEFGIVYCPSLWAEFDLERLKNTTKVLLSRYGNQKSDLSVPVLDVGSDLLPDRRQWDMEDQKEENRRLLYVALTRARHQCVVHWIGGKSATLSAPAPFMCPDMDEKDADEVVSEMIRRWAEELEVPRVAVLSSDEIAALADPGPCRWTALRSEQFTSRQRQRLQIPALLQTSYSALVRMLPAHAWHEWTDRDDGHDESETLLSAGAGERTPLADMPGGTRLGDVVHRLLENVLKKEIRAASLSSTLLKELTEELRRAALDTRWSEALTATLVSCVNQTLAPLESRCRLMDIPVAHRACEVPFVLRLGSSSNEVGFDLGRLAECFEHADAAFVRDYADRIRSLTTEQLQGVLVGFIDLVFQWGGRWYVVDYKTTNLGPRFSDYSTERLQAAMADHDYILQYHLYAVAVSQFLKQRLPDFDVERDFGGVLYFFLRGVNPEATSLGGLFFDRPSSGLIADITAALQP